MANLKYEQIVKKLMELDKRLTTIEEWIDGFTPFRPPSYNDSLDPLYIQAEELVKKYDFASASLLQRRLSVGYARASRLLDQLEEKGVVGPGEGAKPRKVFKLRKKDRLTLKNVIEEDAK